MRSSGRPVAWDPVEYPRRDPGLLAAGLHDRSAPTRPALQPTYHEAAAEPAPDAQASGAMTSWISAGTWQVPRLQRRAAERSRAAALAAASSLASTWPIRSPGPTSSPSFTDSSMATA